MKTLKSSGMFKPFENLKTLLETHSAPLTTARPPRRDSPGRNAESSQPVEDEARLFLEAVADVRPIGTINRVQPHIEAAEGRFFDQIDPEAESLEQLENLVKYGIGFNVSDTPEYIAGSGYEPHPEIIRRLHRGDFSIQAHLDLHGFGVADAKNAFESFLKNAVSTGKRAVLIVHGRGLSSPSKPVLKTKVVKWITSAPWRKWIIAYSSARLCDGGAGATYLLLRCKPVTKSQKRRQNRSKYRLYKKSA